MHGTVLSGWKTKSRIPQLLAHRRIAPAAIEAFEELRVLSYGPAQCDSRPVSAERDTMNQRNFAVGRLAVPSMMLLLSLAAPSAWGQKSADKAAEDRLGFRKSVLAIRGQIDSTLKALNAIVEGKDAKARKSALKQYGEEVKGMEKEIEKTRDYAQKMKERGQAYFKQWEKSMKGVTNESLKASANERREALKAQYDKVESGIEQAKEVSGRFWKNVQDLQKYFANDMSDSAIATSAELVATTNADGKKIQESIDEVVAAVDKVGAEQKAEAKEPEPKKEGEEEKPEGK